MVPWYHILDCVCLPLFMHSCQTLSDVFEVSWISREAKYRASSMIHAGLIQALFVWVCSNVVPGVLPEWHLGNCTWPDSSPDCLYASPLGSEQAA